MRRFLPLIAGAVLIIGAAIPGGAQTRMPQMTFRELDQDSDRIARGLFELGVSPGTRLALPVARQLL